MTNVEEQIKQIDDMRSTKGIDYNKIFFEVNEVVEDRINNDDVKPTKPHPYAKTKCPKLYEAACSYEREKLDEFKEILVKMIANLRKVQSNRLSQSECTKNVIVDDLDVRFWLRPHKRGLPTCVSNAGVK